MIDVILLLVCSFAVAAAALTITHTYAFRWLRGFAQDYLPEPIVKLVTCPYCLAHWFALPLIVVYKPLSGVSHPLVDFTVAWFCCVGLSALWMGLVWKGIGSIPSPRR